MTADPRTAGRPTPPRIRPLTRAELNTVVDWAAQEGWNPGLADADVFWATDAKGFYAIEQDGQLVGSASVVTYRPDYAFAGFFIVRPEWRGRRLGGDSARELLRRTSGALDASATVGIDGVFAMQPYYATLGFVLSHRDLRMAGVGKSLSPAEADAAAELVTLDALPFDDVVTFDAAHFGARRAEFLRRWMSPAGGLGVGATSSDGLLGIGVVRPCRDGFKIGPLFAADADVAEAIFARLSAHAVGQPLFLDIPECNLAAVALAARHGLSESFGCARMYRGPIPELPWQQVFGVTTFELG